MAKTLVGHAYGGGGHILIAGHGIVSGPRNLLQVAWQLLGGATQDGTAVSNTIETGVFARQELGLTVGATYRASFSITARTSGSVSFNVGSAGAGTARSAIGDYEEDIVCAGIENAYLSSRFGSPFVGTVDNFSLIRL